MQQSSSNAPDTNPSKAKSSGLRTVFFGTPEFASYILEHLLANGEEIVAVVTTPAKQQGRGLKVRMSAVQAVAEKHGIPVLAPLKLRDPQFREELSKFDADIFCVVAYKILPKEIFTMPRYGSFNIHGSLLPKYRGAAPINWAIIRGESETGITTFLLDEKVDTGKMLLSDSVAIGPDDTAGELHDALMHIGATLAQKTLLGLADGSLEPRSQPEMEATSAPKIFPKDCIIDFFHPRVEVHNFIRGLSPYPGGTTEREGTKLKILRTRLVEESTLQIAPGSFQISTSGKQLFVGTLDAPLEILYLQREGKSVLGAEEFLRGGKNLFANQES